MKINPAFRLCLPLAAALVILAASLLYLPHNTRAALPTGDQAAIFQTYSSEDTEPAPLPDPHWLALSKAAETAPPAASGESAQAAVAFSINIDLIGGHIAGRVPLPTQVTLNLIRAGVTLVTRTTFPVLEPGTYFYSFSPDYTWEICDPYPYYCTLVRPEENDVLWLEQSGAVFSMTVPHLTALASPELEQVYGEAIPGAALRIFLYPEEDSNQVYSTTTTAVPGGAYSASLQPADIHRQDGGFSQVEAAPGRYAYRAFRAPLLGAHVGGDIIYGSAAPYHEVSIDVIRLGTPDEIIGSTGASVDKNGAFTAYWQNLTEGLVLQAECAGQTFSMTVPRLTASAEIAASVVSGETLPGAPVEVRRFDGPINYYLSSPWLDIPAVQTSLVASPSGAYTASLPLVPPDYGIVLVTLPDEQQAFTHFVTPFLLANVGAGGQYDYPYIWRTHIWGQLPVYNQPVSLTVQGPSGFLKDRLQGSTNNIGYLMLQGVDNSGLVIESGDRITVTSPGFAPLHIPIPLFTAEGDREANRVSGKAPPGSSLQVTVQDDYYIPPYPEEDYGLPQATMNVTATVYGDYLADFTGRFTFTQWTYASVILWTPENHGLRRPVEFPPVCPPVVTGARVGGNRVEFDAVGGCAETYLRLLAPDGSEKGTGVIPPYVWEPAGIGMFDRDYQPAIITPGDWLEINYLGAITLYEVPAITARIDEQALGIVGTAPAGMEVTALLNPPGAAGMVITGTAGLDGSYLLPISNPDLLTAGLQVRVMLSSAKPAFYVLDVLPLLETTLYYYRMYGTISPDSAYTLTWQSYDGADEFTTAGVSYSDGYFFMYMDDPGRIVSPGDQISLQSSGRAVSMTVPLLSAEIELPSATVTGKAPSDSRLEVHLSEWDGNFYGYPDETQIVTATASGDFSAPFPELAPLTRAEGAVIYRDPHGHTTYYDFASPYLDITINEECMGGSVPAMRQPYVLTHQPLAGLTQVVTGTASSYNGLFGVCLLQVVQPGDHFMLESPAGTMVLTYTVPLLSIHHDFERQAVIGRAPPLAELQVSFMTYFSMDIVRRTTAGLDGVFGIDTSDLDLVLRSFGQLIYYDSGARLRSNFVVTGYNHFFPVMMR
jgi:hypothetical protein